MEFWSEWLQDAGAVAGLVGLAALVLAFVPACVRLIAKMEAEG